MARNSKGGKILSYIVWGFVALLVGAAVIGMVRDSIEDSKDREYHEKAYPIISQLGPSSVTGDKAVSYNFSGKSDDEGQYTSRNVPEEYATDDPSQVRYVIKRTEGSRLVGTYSGGGGGGYRRTLTVEILDLKTGKTLGTNTFEGGQPPTSVKSTSKGPHYGSYPSETEISEWVLSVLNAAGK